MRTCSMDAAHALRASILATKLGQEIGVPVGSAWYPGFARGIQLDLDSGQALDAIEADRRVALDTSALHGAGHSAGCAEVRP